MDNPDIDRPRPMTHRPSPPSGPAGGRLPSVEDSYQHYDEDRPKKRRRHRLVRLLGWLLLALVLAAGIGAAVWHFWLSKDSDGSAQSQFTVGDPGRGNGKPAITTPPAATAVPTETYTSNVFGLQFDYPQDWKVTEGTDNTLTAVSAATKMAVVSGGQQSAGQQLGQIVMTIRHQQTSLPEFSKGDAQAARESEKLAYAKPGQSQRAETYLSFLAYAGGAGQTDQRIDAIHVTGDNGYQKGQLVPQSDIVKSDPLITVSFRGCLDDRCASPGPALALQSSVWDDPSFAKPVKAILQSIVVN